MKMSTPTRSKLCRGKCDSFYFSSPSFKGNFLQLNLTTVIETFCEIN